MKYYITYIENNNAELSQFLVTEDEPAEQIAVFECPEGSDVIANAMATLIEVLGNIDNSDIYI